MENLKFYDTHSDLPTKYSNLDLSLSIALSNQKKGYKVINAIYKGRESFSNCLNLAKTFFNKGLSVAFEDCCYQDYIVVNDKISKIKIKECVREMYSCKPQYLSLGWNYNNIYCGGCANEGELTDYGKVFIDEANSFGIAIDTAHCNKKSFYSIIECSDRVLCSHSALEWVYPHRRNLDKQQIRTLLEKGGVFGLIGVGHFLSGIKSNGKNALNAFCNHVKEYINVFGINGLCIGTDFYGSDAPFFNDGDYNFIALLTEMLKNNGLKDEEVKMILYNNALNFFKNTSC